jgi:histidine ammonia-lyase
MSIILNGSGLTVEKLVRLARYKEQVELSKVSLERIKTCRAMLEEKIKARKLCNKYQHRWFCRVVLNDDQVRFSSIYLQSARNR